MPEKERERDETSKRIGCKAFMKLKINIKDGTAHVERVMLEHNHPLSRMPSLDAFMKSHKNFDSSLMELIDAMQTSKVPHNALMNVLSEMHGGHQNIQFTARDLKNR